MTQEKRWQFSDEPDCISRTFCTKAFIECRDTIESWMKEAGLQTYIDNMGNVRGKLNSEKPEAKIFVIASHYDTVINAGKYDGTGNPSRIGFHGKTTRQNKQNLQSILILYSFR